MQHAVSSHMQMQQQQQALLDLASYNCMQVAVFSHPQ
jgi:acetyl-CoA carboxylase beta subunit